MASNPYEVEHNIKASTSKPHPRRPDMESFYRHLHVLQPESASESPHSIGPAPAAVADLIRLLADQLRAVDFAEHPQHGHFAELFEELRADINDPKIKGVSQEYLDTLDRVPKKQLKKDDSCPICAEPFLDDPYPLVVELPCKGNVKHKFDMECIAPWLLSKGDCPMCRENFTEEKKKVKVLLDDSGDEDDYNGLYM